MRGNIFQVEAVCQALLSTLCLSPHLVLQQLSEVATYMILLLQTGKQAAEA